MDETCPLCTGGRGGRGTPRPTRPRAPPAARLLAPPGFCARHVSRGSGRRISVSLGSVSYLGGERLGVRSSSYILVYILSSGEDDSYIHIYSYMLLSHTSCFSFRGGWCCPGPSPQELRESDEELVRGEARGKAGERQYACEPLHRLERDETCPVSTGGWTRRVHFVREGGGGGTAARSERPGRGRLRSAYVGACAGATLRYLSSRVIQRTKPRRGPSPPPSLVLSGHAAPLTPY